MIRGEINMTRAVTENSWEKEKEEDIAESLKSIFFYSLQGLKNVNGFVFFFGIFRQNDDYVFNATGYPHHG